MMEILKELTAGAGWMNLAWQNFVMFGVGGLLIYLAIAKGYEPLLLIPIGFGAVVANLPLAEMSASSSFVAEHGEKLPLLQLIYSMGIKTELLPPIIFLGVGALTDFRPLLARPLTFLLGAAAQLGIFAAALGAHFLFGFTLQEAASIGIIGGADGPTSIFLTSILAPTCWARWRWPPTATWRWSPSSSPRSSGCSPPNASARSPSRPPGMSPRPRW